MSSSKLEHLKMLQAVITRMAGNSFLIKGWCVTLVAALLTLSAKEARYLVFVAYLPVLMFWWLDALFLRQERLFGELFDKVRTNGNDEADFSMKPLGNGESKVESQFKIASSKTLGWFYGWLLLAVSAAAYVVTRLLPPIS